ncbi:hypothetical protein Tco_0410016 [Tanacetum coccineum]
MLEPKVQGDRCSTYNHASPGGGREGICNRMFPEETDKIERYVGGMPDLIYSSVVASKPKTMQEAIEMATELMDRRINTLAERQTENKRKFEDAPRNNQNQQPNKRQNTGRAYAAATSKEGLTTQMGKNRESGNGKSVARAYAVGLQGKTPRQQLVRSSTYPTWNFTSIYYLSFRQSIIRPISLHHGELQFYSSRRKEDSLMNVQDYRELNKLTVKKPLSASQELMTYFDQLQASQESLRAFEDNIGVVEERGVVLQNFPSVNLVSPKSTVPRIKIQDEELSTHDLELSSSVRSEDLETLSVWEGKILRCLADPLSRKNGNHRYRVRALVMNILLWIS